MLETNNLIIIISILLSVVALYFILYYNKDKKEDGLKTENFSSGMKKVVDEINELNNRLTMLENKMPILNNSISNNYTHLRNRINDLNDREHFRQAYLIASAEAAAA